MPKAKQPTASGANSVFVDSGAWIALLSARDQHHSEADALFRRAIAARNRIVTSNLVLAEVHRLLLHRVGIAAARAFLARTAASPSLEISHATEDNHAAALDWIDRYPDQAFTYADAVSFAIMKSRGCRRVIAFDHHFERAGFELLRES